MLPRLSFPLSKRSRPATDPAKTRHAGRLFEDTVRALYRHEISAVFGHFAAAAMVGAFLFHQVPSLSLWFLTAAVGSCAILRLALVFRFRRLRRAPAELDQRLHSLAIVGCACAWSVGFLTALSGLSDAYRAFMMMVLAGLTAGSLVTLSSRLRSFALFSSLLLGPPIVGLLLEGGALDGQIAAMAVLFLAFCLSGAAKVSRSFQDGLLKRYQNQEIMADLAGAKHELEIAWGKSEAANQAKQRFLANVSHEVRTPLNGILGITDMLLESGVTEEQRGLAEIVKRCGSNLLLMINDLLDLSKIESGKMKVERIAFEPEPLFRDVEALHAVNAATRGVVVRLTIEPGMPATITGDPTRLRQVMNNLVGNAVKFTDQGEVRIRAGLSVLAGAARLTVEVADDGVGIPADRIEAIFESFVQADDSTTRKHGGTGLGLSITRSLVELMGGTIHVQSTFGVGSTFRFEIPLDPADLRAPAPASAPPPPAAAAPAAALGQGRRVLLAEDGEVNAMVLKKIFQRLGFAVQRVRDGQEAVDAFPGSRADLVVLDLQMPRMDGFSAARAIRRGGAAVPILALSAHCDDEERERCRAAGMDEALPKPCSESRLRQVLAALLAQAPTGAGR